jgi:3-(3-hydroxy-phenyl)propionate hydroxylase
VAARFLPVVIIGAGPTGLAAANLLGQYGIETLVVERNSGGTDLPRAITIDDEGLRICQALGLRAEVLKHVLLDVGLQFFSHGRLVMRIPPGGRRNGYPLVSTLSQPGLEATLLAGLRRFARMEVLFGHTLDSFSQTEHEVLVRVQNPAGRLEEIACSYLLGCDGGKSLVRRILGVSMRGASFSQKWLVVDGDVGKDSGPGPYISCFYDSNRPVVSIPAPGQYWRWEFMLRPEEREDVDFLGRERDRGCVTPTLRRLLWHIGDVREPRIVRQTVYAFHASCATSFAQGRVFLLGDAAHLLPPFGGQGMNSGLRDACNLAWKLALVVRGQAQARILATYEQERMPHVLEMIQFATFLGRQLVMPMSRARSFLRDFALRAIMKLPPIASTMKQMRMKPQSFYRTGLILADRDGHRCPAGRLLPQPTVRLSGDRSMLVDELLGSGFALVRLHTDPKEAFKPLQADIWRKLRPRRICLVPTVEDAKKSCDDVTLAWDGQRQIARFLKGRHHHFALIRPDRHVLGTFPVDKEQAFVAALRERFLT